MNVSPKNEHIPRATIQRLATYLQVLEAMHIHLLAEKCAYNAL